MLHRYLNIASNKGYWLALLMLALSLELSALFYQYVLDYPLVFYAFMFVYGCWVLFLYHYWH